MSTILVTGASGFLGRHVSRVAATQGHHVIGMGHGDWQEETWRQWGLSAWHELDVTLASLVAHVGTPDVLVHCAGSSSVGFSLENPAQDFERTVVTTLDVLEYLRTSAPDTALVYPSSAAVYGQASALPIVEDSLRAPISPYGVHKMMVEDLCRSYGRTFGTRVAIVRIFSAYGVELRKQLLWDAARKAVAGDFRFAGSGRETRDWVNAEDVARLLLIAGGHAASEAPIVNGSSGIEVANRSVLEALLEGLGAKGSPEFTGKARSGDPERYAGDPSRASAWGWAPQRAWQEGVREYARWFLEISH
ncbi:MAG: NAD-dependent epimerase/dehydratase family protein [Chloroflexota bacterium]|nr:NAD-dependent epimerase/dehydratase family protein [Chloroflexota bacterium]